MEREVDELVEKGVTGEEVQRAIALIQTDIITALQSASERADRISMFATLLGDPAVINTQADKYGAVTRESVNAFARDRLGADNRAKLIYVPRIQEEGEAEAEIVEAMAS